MKRRKFNTDFLFPVQDEITGIASVLDIFHANTVYNYSKTDTEADQKAIAHDWAAIGEDLSDVINKYIGKNE